MNLGMVSTVQAQQSTNRVDIEHFDIEQSIFAVLSVKAPHFGHRVICSENGEVGVKEVCVEVTQPAGGGSGQGEAWRARGRAGGRT